MIVTIGGGIVVSESPCACVSGTTVLVGTLDEHGPVF